MVETWSSPAEASSITGESITQEELDVAYHVVEMFVGVTPAARANIKPRNLRLLKQAEAYQAAWMAKQVELTGRSDVELVTQDGLQYSKGDRDTHILSPLAKVAMGQLSWRRSKPIEALTPRQALALRGKRTPETIGLDVAELNTDIDEDGFQVWRPF